MCSQIAKGPYPVPAPQIQSRNALQTLLGTKGLHTKWEGYLAGLKTNEVLHPGRESFVSAGRASPERVSKVIITHVRTLQALQ